LSSPRGLRWIVKGRVQGVSYRYFAQQNAAELGLCGFTKNLADGTVEVQVEGDAAELGAFKARLREGPPQGRVDEITESELAPHEGPRWQRFDIRY
jgi:acylphosphatase